LPWCFCSDGKCLRPDRRSRRPVPPRWRLPSTFGHGGHLVECADGEYSSWEDELPLAAMRRHLYSMAVPSILDTLPETISRCSSFKRRTHYSNKKAQKTLSHSQLSKQASGAMFTYPPVRPSPGQIAWCAKTRSVVDTPPFFRRGGRRILGPSVCRGSYYQIDCTIPGGLVDWIDIYSVRMVGSYALQFTSESMEDVAGSML
jgi:hypothetical protein